jgi:hypothetical protein
MRNIGILTGLVAASALGLCAAGCNSKSDQGQTINETPEQLRQKEQAQIARLRNDASLPPQARAAALAAREAGKAHARSVPLRRVDGN